MENNRGNRKPQTDRRGAQNSGTPRDKRAMRSEPAKFTSEESKDGSERIAKRLARAGIASRRDAETMIAAGRITVNGKVLESPAFNVTRTDVITVDGKPLPPIERTRVWLYHKRAGLVTTNRDPEGRPTVFDNLPEGMPRVLSVGRLDINTEGLLLLTNDGGLARVLELPSTGWVRKYRVRAHGKITQNELDTLKNGIAIDGVFYGSVDAFLEREQGSNVWLSVALREGKNREVKNILGALGLSVTRLIRVSFGPFQLADLEEGAVRELKGRTLRDQLGERLIEEANADFDLPIIKPFSNSPVVADEPARGNIQKSEDGWISSSPNMPRFNKRGKKPDFTERGRMQLATKPDRWNEKRGNRFDAAPSNREKPSDEKREASTPRSRSTNVWMAPGARPQTARKKQWNNYQKTDDARPAPSDRHMPRHVDGERPKRFDNDGFKRREDKNAQYSHSDRRPSIANRSRSNRSDDATGYDRPFREPNQYHKKSYKSDERPDKSEKRYAPRRSHYDGNDKPFENKREAGNAERKRQGFGKKRDQNSFRDGDRKQNSNGYVKKKNFGEKSSHSYSDRPKKTFNRSSDRANNNRPAGGSRADRRR